MARDKKTNGNRFHKATCIRCGEQVTRRNSWAIRLNRKGEEKLILARDSKKQVITRAAAPRIHREMCHKEGN